MRRRSPSTLPPPADRMGVYKLSILDLEPKSSKSPRLFPKSSFLRGTAATFMGRRASTKVQPTLHSFVESPGTETMAIRPSVDPMCSSSSEDDTSCSSSHFTTSSKRTSNFLTSDDDACLRELSLSGGFDNCYASLARHSTACCTDGAVRQELRRKFHIDDATSKTPVRKSFAMGRCSFRRELDTTEDCVESLALWEETSETLSTSAKARAVRKDLQTAYSWPHGHVISPSGNYSGKLNLETLFRKPKKKTSSFFTGWFSGLSLSSRRSRKW